MISKKPPRVMEVKTLSSEVEDKGLSDANQSNRKDSIEDASFWNCLYIFPILAVCSLNAAILFLIPKANLILNPEFWYETMVYLVIGVSARQAASHILELYIFTKVKGLLNASHYIKVLLTHSLSFSVPFCVSFVVWTMCLEYNHPFPLVGAFLFICDISVNMVFFWFFFPHELRKQETIKRQAKAFLMFRVWALVQNLLRGLLLDTAESSQQWLLILLIPMVRNFSIWVAEGIVKRIADTNTQDVRFLARSESMINYTTYLAGRIATLNRSTIYGIFIAELLLHLISCYQIVKMNNRIENDDKQTAGETKVNDIRESIQTLVMSEFTEAVVPIAFSIVFTMAFFGPNASLMNGIGNNYFGDPVIEDVQTFYFDMLQMLAFDVIVMIISVMALKYLCRINLFQEFCNVMKRYWMIFLIKVPSITLYFVSKDVNLGFDRSRNFLWITKEGRNQLICNSIEVIDEKKIGFMPNCTLFEQ